MKVLLELRRPKLLKQTYISSVHDCNVETSRTLEFIRSLTRKYEKIVHFNICEIKLILLLFKAIVGGDIEALLSEDGLKSFLSAQFDITNIKSLEGLTRAFKIKSRGKEISAEEFLLGLSVFLRGSLQERAKFTFKAFDVDGDGYLRRKDEIPKYLQDSFDPKSEAVESEIDTDEPARETANYLWNKFNCDEKADVDVLTFTRLCLHDPILMECLTPVYPTDSKILTFQNLLFRDVYAPSYLTLPEVSESPGTK